MKLEEQAPSSDLHRVMFTIYKPEDIKLQSVLEITSVESFDALGHPTTGGLYDPRLGPNERDEQCQTCGQRSLNCPGHLGHINLPLLVFNPLFIRDTFQLLNGTCFQCKQLRASKVPILLMASQLKALNYGFVATAQEMEAAVFEITANMESNLSHTQLTIETKLDEILGSAIEGLDLQAVQDEARLKNVMDFRRILTRKFVQENIAKAPRKCTGCGSKKLMMFLEYNSRIIIRRMATRQKANKPRKSDFSAKKHPAKEEEADDDDDYLDGDLGRFKNQTYLTPKQAKEHLIKVYENEKLLLSQLYTLNGLDETSPIDGFFIDVLPVAPSRFRPVAFMRDQKFENPHSMALSRLLQDCYVIRSLLYAIKTGTSDFGEAVMFILKKIPGESHVEKLQNAWTNLQRRVNAVFDSDLDKLQSDKLPGVKQLLEKKEGLFRMHMMGKRVNYAARSVISPDPYIDVDEIGIPAVFATKLTYPEAINRFNAAELKQAVLNGPDVHPGATMVKNEDGFNIFLGRDLAQRQRIANKLFNHFDEDSLKGSKYVYRHLKNGDMLLLNRQPTLHKPSIMAHKARVLYSEKTLRLNYSTCKTYNADFDGDEMNAHFPQSEAARSEAYFIASVENQYLVPKDGTPLGGLIQDHIIGAAKLMTRGRFFNREDYMQLVYSGVANKKGRITLLPPAIVKPYPMWSGKQVVSTVVINIVPPGKSLINLIGTSKIADKCWQRSPPRKCKAGGVLKPNEMSEHEVIVRQGELLCGIFDKAHCGPTPYGLIHCCYELYGGRVATVLLSQLERVFTYYLQYIVGFSLGVEDILVVEKANKKRHRIMRNSKELGYDPIRTALKISDSATDSEVKDQFVLAHLSIDDKLMKDIDNSIKSRTNEINNQINDVCLPGGLLKPFPDNCLQLMVISGAKGSSVNCMQISSLLGQIELEGRRPPLMISGRSLPTFLPYSTTTRSGGFVDRRFLTGLELPEYFFHCMAGREGLIDTAVKTSRSGYLQRCLIKHLEGVTVAYDMTVRDSDGSVIQFQYGEDGLDIGKLPFLISKEFPFLADNFKAVKDDELVTKLKADEKFNEVSKFSKKVRKWLKKGDASRKSSRTSGFLKFSEKHEYKSKEEMTEAWFDLDPSERASYNCKANKRLDPAVSIYRQDQHFGSISENLDAIIESYTKSGLTKMPADVFRDMMYYKIQTSVCEPGEAVGLLAAQSIGEPSTQMTLNTFHFAGRGEMNVTLGIPRLREILMTASANISTPSLEVPILGDNAEEIAQNAEYMKKRLTRIYLSDVLQDFELLERSNFSSSNRNRTYVVRFNFLPRKAYRKRLNTSPSKILRFMEKAFFSKLMMAIKSRLRIMANTTMLHNIVLRDSEESKSSKAKDDEEAEVDQPENDASNVNFSDKEGESSDEEENVDEDDATANRNRTRHQQDREYEELDEEEKQLVAETSLSDHEDNGNEGEGEVDESKHLPAESLFEDEEPIVEDKPQLDANEFLFENEEMLEMDENASQRVKNVLDLNTWISDYKFDTKKEQWCQLTLKMNIVEVPKLNLNGILEEQVQKGIVYHVPGIKKAFMVDQNDFTGACQKILKTDGINIKEMFNYANMVNLRRLYSNDIHAIAQTYGIEAASRVILKEIKNVFMVYGIEVDPRHLLLVADYMTFDGYYKPFNRIGMENSVSPLQQMSFESTMKFLKMATLSGSPDLLKSPSSRLVMGRPVLCGTGSFTLVHPIRAGPASQ